MIVGNPSVLAIESAITQAYRELNFRAMGYFNLHIGGVRYGVLKSDATMLACSFDRVGERIATQGMHTAPFSSYPDANYIADAFRNAIYADQHRDEFLGLSLQEFSSYFGRDSNDIVWAPDGDQAFDDGSYILQFDIKDRVRLISFRGTPDYRHDPASLRDVWMPHDKYYGILIEWHELFHDDWSNLTTSHE